MKKYVSIILSITLSCILFSCEEKDKEEVLPETVLEVKLFKNLKADVASKNQFTFFSLENNDTIPRSDSATTKWDLAFKNTIILINGGTSGPGSTTARVYTGLFDELTEVPTNDYSTDGGTPVIMGGSGNGWYNYNSSSHVITPIPGRVILVKTSSGKYAKIEILSYYKDMPASPVNTDPARYYSFRFVLQPDGSTSLQ